MSGTGSETKTVFRILWAWNDQGEERWLRRAGGARGPRGVPGPLPRRGLGADGPARAVVHLPQARHRRVLQVAPHIASGSATGVARHPAVLGLQVGLLGIFAYGLVRLILAVNKLKKQIPRP